MKERCLAIQAFDLPEVKKAKRCRKLSLVVNHDDQWDEAHGDAYGKKHGDRCGVKCSDETCQDALLYVHKLGKHFWWENNTVRILKDISFSLKAGDCLPIIGASGSGKSLLGYILAGWSRGSEGRIHVGGNRWPHLAWQSKPQRLWPVQMVRQSPFRALQGVGAIYNVVSQGFVNRSRDESIMEVESCLSLVSLNPNKYIFRDVGHLNRLEYLQVLLAYKLMGKPKVLILDDIFENLDKGERCELQAVLRNVQSNLNTAIIALSPVLGEVRELSPRVGLLIDGRLRLLHQEKDMVALQRAYRQVMHRQQGDKVESYEGLDLFESWA